ncbi:MAG: tRNA (uridine(34)/cytosine(34)/5-carboxymethylaminomethyluridine(34)-2'-O)-methyltransferase TrmL [Pseudomonadota bacterium]|nr:tRNA (uridine(34)/cytosine(34)/5-carboxymethylaminomethyluridine(34)-2'-O)-methyltransferase TrmL [Pseudomonadota bacterium]
MFHVVLFEPEIPPNTGNIIRLCANTGSSLHLIHPLGFEMSDSRMRRAGLDYHEYAQVNEYASYADFLERTSPQRLFAISTKGTARYCNLSYESEDYFLFGPESRGLPADILHSMPAQQCVRIPMQPHSRSLNLANSVTLMLYEAWRQHGFSGAI